MFPRRLDRIFTSAWRVFTTFSRLERLYLALGVVFCLLRFVGLETSPPGFFSDEVRGALHQICLGEDGVSGYGEPWPLFIEGLGGGLYTPVFLYVGMAWIKLFGPTIASCRAFTAFFTVLAVIGTAQVARRVAGPRVALYVFLAGALSPWSFHFARIAWDPPLAPAFLIWAVYFWLCRNRRSRLVVSAACFSAALYLYPPTRIQAPLVFLALGAWALFRKSVRWQDVLVFGAVAAVLCLPLIAGTLDGSLMKRGAGEAVWAKHWVDRYHEPYSRGAFILFAFLDHLHAHLRPTFLFFIGDRNLRHSTQHFGELSLLDDLVLAAGLLWGIRAAFRGATARPQSPSPKLTSEKALESRAQRIRLIGLGVVGVFLGVVPAALCWSGVPHALRSIGAWPFLALATGAVLSKLAAPRTAAPGSTNDAPRGAFADAWRQGPSVCVLAFTLLHAGAYPLTYFAKYPDVKPEWFDVPAQQAMLDPDFNPSERQKLLQRFPEGFRYYAIAYGGQSCASSEASWQRWLKDPRQRPLEAPPP